MNDEGKDQKERENNGKELSKVLVIKIESEKSKKRKEIGIERG